MPELPEVETTRRGIAPFLLKQSVRKVIIRQPQLRWPIEPCLPELLLGQQIKEVDRRGKYLLIKVNSGCLIIHLGMSGHLRVLSQQQAVQQHDHFDLELANGEVLRYTDPRRFGCVLWTEQDPLKHKLLINLGPEPLSTDFSAEYLFKRSRQRRLPIKTFIMSSQQVVGVGNIYANEALFQSGINPLTPAGKLSKVRISRLVEAIKVVLRAAIKRGGTTLKDFYGVNGEAGYFSLSLAVYGRGGKACNNCQTPLKEIRLGQRQTVYCPRCQR